MAPSDRKKTYSPTKGFTEKPKNVAVTVFILSALFFIPGALFLGFAPGTLPYDSILMIVGIVILIIGFAFYFGRFILERF